MNKNILVIGLQFVLTFLGAFGAILQDILPNQIGNKPIIYGITQFCCLFVFLFLKVSFFRNKTIYMSRWLIFSSLMFATFLLSFWFFYHHEREALLHVGENSAMVIIGDELTPRGLKACHAISKSNDGLTQKQCAEQLLDEGDVSDAQWIWTKKSISYNKDLFIIFYILMVISLSTAIFSLVEIISANKAPVPLDPH